LEDVNAFYEADSADFKPTKYLFDAGDKRNIRVADQWEFDTRKQTDSPHFSWNDEFAGVEEYAVWGWHRWNLIPDKTSWYLIYRLHTTKNAQNADNLGDRTLALWIGDNVYHPATYNAA